MSTAVPDLYFTPERVRRIRGERSSREFAELVGVTERVVSMWLRADRHPRETRILMRLLELENADK